MNFVDYYSLLLKIKSRNLIGYFDQYLNFLETEGILSSKDATRMDNRESKRIFIELLIIAIVQNISDVTKNGNVLGNIQELKSIWNKTFLKLDIRLSATEVLTASEEEIVDFIAEKLDPKEIVRLCYEITKEVVNAPLRMSYYTPQPILSEEGVHSIEEKWFMNLEEMEEDIDFFS